MTVLDRMEELAAENAVLTAEVVADHKRVCAKARRSIRNSNKVLKSSGFQFKERTQVKRRFRDK